MPGGGQGGAQAAAAAAATAAAAAERARSVVEIFAVNAGGVRDTLPAGPLLWGQVFQVWPWSESAWVCEVSGALLQALVGLNALTVRGERGAGMFCALAGVEYQVDTATLAGSSGSSSSSSSSSSSPRGETAGSSFAHSIRVGGTALDIARWYALASSAYIVTFFLPSLAVGTTGGAHVREMRALGFSVRDAMLAEMKVRGRLARWSADDG